jgi:hypothetical protein
MTAASILAAAMKTSAAACGFWFSQVEMLCKLVSRCLLTRATASGVRQWKNHWPQLASSPAK